MLIIILPTFPRRLKYIRHSFKSTAVMVRVNGKRSTDDGSLLSNTEWVSSGVGYRSLSTGCDDKEK